MKGHGPRHGDVKRREADRAACATGQPCRTPGKVNFPSRRAARRTASKHLDTPTTAYRCDCGYWHLTSLSAESKARTREWLAR